MICTVAVEDAAQNHSDSAQSVCRKKAAQISLVQVLQLEDILCIHHLQHIAFFTLGVLPKQIFQIDLKTSFQCSNKDETGFYILTKITRWRPNCKILQTNIKVVISPISSLKIW